MPPFNFPAGFNPSQQRVDKRSKGGLSTDQKAARSRRQRQQMKRHMARGSFAAFSRAKPDPMPNVST